MRWLVVFDGVFLDYRNIDNITNVFRHIIHYNTLSYTSCKKVDLLIYLSMVINSIQDS